MLYRIQTIYLIFVFIIYCLSLIKIPFIFDSNRLINNYKNITLYYNLIIILLLITIFSYKNRKLQIFFNKINIILNIILFLFFCYKLFFFQKNYLYTYRYIILYNIIPILSIIFLILSNKYIKKDLIIIKSIDRIR